MLRSKTYWVVLALVMTGIATACTRADITGPANAERQPSFENQGAAN